MAKTQGILQMEDAQELHLDQEQTHFTEEIQMVL